LATGRDPPVRIAVVAPQSERVAVAHRYWRRRYVSLFALDVLYDLEHGIYTKPQGGVIEMAINLLTLMLSAGLLRFAWRFRRDLLSTQKADW
jgi:hypothetical protein